MMTKEEAKQKLEEAGVTGIDWASINWQQLFQIFTALISVFTQTKPPMQAASGAGCTPEQQATLKAHFDAITAISTCGSTCCGG